MERFSKLEATSVLDSLKGLIFSWELIVGALAYVASLGFYLFAIKDVKLSIGYPISVSCAIVLVTILSSALLKESISVTQLVGTAIILFGIFVLTR
jgi:multidrug transporter EmrE-like cation transporter